MTIEETIRGESRNVEFKERLPENSEKYTKFFRVNLYRRPLPMQSIDKTSAKHRRNIGDESADAALNITQCRIVEMLSAEPRATGAVLAEQIGISKRNIEANIKSLKEQGVLVRHGSSKSGYWEVVKNC